MIQRGSQSLSAGVDNVSVTFSQALADVPELLLVGVLRQGGSGDAYVIQHTVTERTAAGFTAVFAIPTPDATYEIHWYAADDEVSAVTTLTAPIRRLGAADVAASVDDGADYVLVARQADNGTIKKSLISGLTSGCFRHNSSANPEGSGGTFGEFVFDVTEENLYVRGETGWRKISCTDV